MKCPAQVLLTGETIIARPNYTSTRLNFARILPVGCVSAMLLRSARMLLANYCARLHCDNYLSWRRAISPRRRNLSAARHAESILSLMGRKYFAAGGLLPPSHYIYAMHYWMGWTNAKRKVGGEARHSAMALRGKSIGLVAVGKWEMLSCMR